MSEQGADLAALVARIIDGDSTAEDCLVERFGPGLRLLSRRLTRDLDRAADLEQETLRIVLEKVRRGDLRAPEKLAAFMCATARNTFYAERRKARRFAPLDDLTVVERSLAQASAASGVDSLIRSEEAALVRQLLAELRFDRDRQLLKRYYLTEDSSEHICQDLEIDPSRLNRVLYRARQRLRELALRSRKRRRFAAAAAADDLSRQSPATVHMEREG